MKKKTIILLCLLLNLFAFSQKDSIIIDAKISAGTLTVREKIYYQNTSEIELTHLKLQNFTAAYKSRNTPLVRRKLEDRKKDLYYAKPNERGRLVYLMIDKKPYEGVLDDENLFIKLPKPLAPNAFTELSLEYSVILPSAQFTGYGIGKNNTLLKYFFLVPDSFDRDNFLEKYYKDLEENVNVNTFYRVKFENSGQNISSNLTEVAPNIFEGKLNKDVEFLIADQENYQLETIVDGQKHLVELGYPVTEQEKELIAFYLPLHLHFIKEKTGFLPEKIFISEKFKSKNDFFGNDDIKFWKFKFQMFTDAEKIDMDYFSIVSQQVAEQLFVSDKEKNHWITNGLKTYLEIQYLKKNYPDHKILGALSDYKILGMKPLKLSFASRLKLIERYGLAYQYITAQNLDQKIDEKFSDLSNFNEMAISQFETGSLFTLIAEKMGTSYFENFLKGYIAKNQTSELDKRDFLDQLTVASGYSSEFLEKYVKRKQRINFKLDDFERKDNVININVSKNTAQNIPFKLETFHEDGSKKTFWYDTNYQDSSCGYVIPDNEAVKIVINDLYAFPENNFRDNYLYTKGIKDNAKKLRFKLIPDNPNAEINEVYLTPGIAWNNYDKFLLGIRFKNKSLIDKRFQYLISPFFSTGSKDINGSMNAVYKIQPAESFFRTLTLEFSTAKFNYDFGLSYKKMSFASQMSFNKNPRSQISRSLSASYNFFERDLSPEMIAENDYAKYNIWNLGFVYSDNNVIREKYIFGNFQYMEDYAKLTAESYYRLEYAKNKKLSLRLYGGYFLRNHTRNNNFDIGISKVSNYAFSYNLLAQSAISGILSQQFIMAEGGFKSYINGTVDQWMLTHNVEANVWKMIDVYADFGVYKNRAHSPKFIWDSGIKFKVIPDFIEVYFPMQSSLGFEPKFKDYGNRIRFTFNLNVGALIGYFRRGWY